jgi:hypothetical protein
LRAMRALPVRKSRLDTPGPVAADTVLFGIGDTAADMLNDYQDCMAPPFHPNCRCGIVPVRIEDEQG